MKGEGLFPKQTGALALAFADAIREEMGDDALEQILARVTDARVLGLQSGHDMPLENKVASLRSIYGANDAFVEVEKVSDGYPPDRAELPVPRRGHGPPSPMQFDRHHPDAAFGTRGRSRRALPGRPRLLRLPHLRGPAVDVSRLRFAREPERKKSPQS